MTPKKSPFSVKDRIMSFQHAFAGFKTLVKDEHNARVHLVVTSVVLFASLYFEISTTEWIVLILCVSSVITTEIINSAIENLADNISTDFHPLIKKAKDLGAAAVLLTSFSSLIIGGIIFVPKMINW